MVVTLAWGRRGAVVDCEEGVVVTVDAMVASVGTPGGINELMNSVGESVVGEDKRELRRSDTVLREDCGLLSLIVETSGVVERLVVGERVVPGEETWVFADDHISVSVRGDFDLLDLVDCGLVEGGSVTLSMSIASVGGGCGRRCGEAVMSSALRVRVWPGSRDELVFCASGCMSE